MDLDTFWKTLDDSIFATSASCPKEILYKALDCQELQDSQGLRALCVFMHYELVDAPVKCLACKAPCTLEQGRSPSELFWLCTEKRSFKHSKQHFSVPCLPKVRTNCLLAFLHFCVLMLCNERINGIVEELKAAHGIGRSSVFAWEKIYHEAVSKLVAKKRLNKVGGNKERCAVDGLAVEKVGRVVGNPVSKEASFVRAAQTICAKKPRKQSKSQKQKLFPTPRLALPGPLQQVCAMVVAGRSSHMGKKTHA